MKPEVVSKLSPLEKFAVGVIEKKFEMLAQDCEHQFLDSKGSPNCAYPNSSIGYCQPELCPRLKSKNQMEGDTRGRKQ